MAERGAEGGARLVVVDWGTSSFRAALVGKGEAVVDLVETDEGISQLERGAFEPLLLARLQPWIERHGRLPVVCAGMITSRNGWVEVPYADCPGGVEELAAAAHAAELSNGAPVLFVGGMRDPNRVPFPDVMRGEEVQIVGHGLEREATVVLPGTHSKWARVAGGRIAGFQTFVTGELYALLSRHSFIARGAAAPEAPAWEAFDRGVLHASAREPRALLSDLFSARTGLLAAELRAEEISDYLSGLLLGHEFREARDGGWIDPARPLGLVGNARLSERYGRAAGLLGLRAQAGPEHAAILGALRVAAARKEFSHAAS